MINIYISYSDNSRINELNELKEKYNLQLLDSQSNKTKRKSYMLKSHWGAREDPFAIIMDENEEPIKAFYSEACDVFTELIKYLKNENTSIR